MAAILVGSTGLVGSHILTTLLNSPKFTSVHAYSRKPLPTTSPKLTTIESASSDTWPSLFPSVTGAKVFFSGLGTTKAQAGSFEAQVKIDHDLNLELAKAAKAAGVTTYVLISSSGASSTSMVAYSKMKGQLEDDVEKLGFTHTIVLRPGLIVGARDDSRPAEAVLRKVANVMGSVSGGALKNFWAQDAEIIAKAAVSAAEKAEEREPGLWVLGQADIVRLGKTEWKDADASVATASTDAPAAAQHVETK